MIRDMMPVRRADLQGTAGTYTSTAEARGVLGTAIQHMDAPYTRRTAETSPPEVGRYTSTDVQRGASVILCHAAGV
jgi:hypothetical protein|nr:MAG TPA: hypothetical protein [Caudoviricetes sp.]